MMSVIPHIQNILIDILMISLSISAFIIWVKPFLCYSASSIQEKNIKIKNMIQSLTRTLSGQELQRYSRSSLSVPVPGYRVYKRLGVAMALMLVGAGLVSSWRRNYSHCFIPFR